MPENWQIFKVKINNKKCDGIKTLLSLRPFWRVVLICRYYIFLFFIGESEYKIVSEVLNSTYRMGVYPERSRRIFRWLRSLKILKAKLKQQTALSFWTFCLNFKWKKQISIFLYSSPLLVLGSDLAIRQAFPIYRELGDEALKIKLTTESLILAQDER